MASVMANSLSIESGALAVPESNPSGVRAYKGVPYAAPPIRQLRWRPPEPVAAWKGVRPTHEFGAHSVQGVVWDDIDLSGAATSEDCLHLNVWTPAAPGPEARLPVMVWIHGGGFVVGSGAEARYDGARLAARGIVVVTVNHRLNALGFLAHPELTAESEHHSSGAYGFLDLVAALQWVKRNIAAFGGDPGKVTIAGESAGSHATSALMASPLAKGLFARVIGESGAMFASPSRALASLEEAEAVGLDFMRQARSAFAGRNARHPRGRHSRRGARAWLPSDHRRMVSAALAGRDFRRGRAQRRAPDGRMEQGRRLQFHPASGRRREAPLRRSGARDFWRADGRASAALPGRIAGH